MNMKLIGGFATAVMLIGGLSLAQAEEVKSKAARPAAKKSDRSSREAIIKRFDKDGDGKLSEDERRAAAEYRKKLASRDNAQGSDNDRRDQGARERYAAVAKRISEGVKAGKITEEQGRERLAAFRKNMAEGRRDSDSARPSRASREEITKRFDKNGDGKLDREEGAAARKAIAARRGQGQGGSERGERSRNRDSDGRSSRATDRRQGGRGGENAERRRRGISVEEYRRGETQIRELVNKGKVSKEDAEKRLIEMRKAIRSEKPKGDNRGSQGGSERGERSRNRDSDRRSNRATDSRPRGQNGENAERRRRGSQRGEGRENRRRGNRRGGE